MPEIIRGARASVDLVRPPFSPASEPRVAFSADTYASPSPLDRSETPLSPQSSNGNRRRSLQRQRSDSPRRREERDAYYDSRAATQREFRRRGTTLQQYYTDNPLLLPQLPFTMHHGWRRWRLGLLIFIVVVDTCVVPIILYYGLTFGGNVQGWITFAIVTTVWGGPTYLEFATRTWKLAFKKENFYRPLGSNSKKACDITNWIFVLTITAVTSLFIVGSAPHIVFLRVLSMPGPALLYCLGGSLFIITMWSWSGRPAPFRLSSTPKGGKVYPGVYYFIEDIIAVNANAGRPFREALMARYEASPRFRRMIWNQSLFWSIPSVAIAIILTPIVCVHTISAPVAYGISWAVPFIWGGVWTAISVPWVKRDMRLERETWELDACIDPSKSSTPEPDKDRIAPVILKPVPTERQPATEEDMPSNLGSGESEADKEELAPANPSASETEEGTKDEAAAATNDV